MLKRTLCVFMNLPTGVTGGEKTKDLLILKYKYPENFE